MKLLILFRNNFQSDAHKMTDIIYKWFSDFIDLSNINIIHQPFETRL